MATTRQKQAARRNLEKARRARSAQLEGAKPASKNPGMSSAEKNRPQESSFAFPEQRKEPLVDARHVRNAVSRFDQVEGVSDAERDQAWKRIVAAADRFGVELSESDWRDLFKGGKAHKR